MFFFQQFPFKNSAILLIPSLPAGQGIFTVGPGRHPEQDPWDQRSQDHHLQALTELDELGTPNRKNSIPNIEETSTRFQVNEWPAGNQNQHMERATSSCRQVHPSIARSTDLLNNWSVGEILSQLS